MNFFSNMNKIILKKFNYLENNSNNLKLLSKAFLCNEVARNLGIKPLDDRKKAYMKLFQIVLSSKCCYYVFLDKKPVGIVAVEYLSNQSKISLINKKIINEEQAKNSYNIMYFLLPDYKQKGIGSEMLKQVVNKAFKELKAECLKVGYYEYKDGTKNVASKKVSEKNGFEYVFSEERLTDYPELVKNHISVYTKEKFNKNLTSEKLNEKSFL